ncbi:toxin co-regulated pilus biosynthesis Q family protein [Collimonas humicola]|uniref:toxin co-regulated pilus biosynthesis Q family protein n=1 Tax=Collimonas humicola TaxID=2825886 RepID=UPI001E43AA03|nr:toxin co-regulated pilus biosynthesis Q family protein [Collimonas humicola]
MDSLALFLGACAASISMNAQAADSQAGKYHFQQSLADMMASEDCDDGYNFQAAADTAPTNAYDMSAPQLALLDPKASANAQRPASAKPLEKVALEDISKDKKSAPEVKTSQATLSAAAVKTAPLEPAPLWEIVLADKTLNAAIARWTTAAGWQLSWELSVDYAVEARTAVPGSFEEAVETVAKSMEGAEIPMKAIFYKGNKVLRIVPKGVK